MTTASKPSSRTAATKLKPPELQTRIFEGSGPSDWYLNKPKAVGGNSLLVTSGFR
jgi:hypothetical protein